MRSRELGGARQWRSTAKMRTECAARELGLPRVRLCAEKKEQGSRRGLSQVVGTQKRAARHGGNGWTQEKWLDTELRSGQKRKLFISVRLSAI